MSDPRRYYSGSGSSSNYPLSPYSSLADAMSYPTTNQSNPSAPMPPGQYPPTSAGQGHSAPHPSSAYQQGYGSPSMTGPPTSHNPYPNTAYNPNTAPPTPNTQWSGSQRPPFAPGSYEMLMASLGCPPTPPPISPYVASDNSYAAPAPVHPSSRYMPSESSTRAPEPYAGVRHCYRCHTTTTPLWRRDPATQRTLCNACGLYIQQRHEPRPQELIDADQDGPEEEEGGDGRECSHCHTRQTSAWRRSKEGDLVCNACGLYPRRSGAERPQSLKRNKVKPRAKHPHS